MEKEMTGIAAVVENKKDDLDSINLNPNLKKLKLNFLNYM